MDERAAAQQGNTMGPDAGDPEAYGLSFAELATVCGKLNAKIITLEAENERLRSVRDDLVAALTSWQNWAEMGGCDLDEFEEAGLFTIQRRGCSDSGGAGTRTRGIKQETAPMTVSLSYRWLLGFSGLLRALCDESLMRDGVDFA